MLESPTADSETGEADVLPVLIADEDAVSADLYNALLQDTSHRYLLVCPSTHGQIPI